MGTPSWNKGKFASDEVKREMSKSRKGRTPWNKGIPWTEDVRMKLRESHLGIHPTEETRRKLSEGRRLDKHPNWHGGLSFEPYCPKFDETFKRSIRDRFAHRCYVCGIREIENLTCRGTYRKLAVHHCDYNKNSICNGHDWAFVPLCLRCHQLSNYDRHGWFNKLIYYWLNNHLDFNLNVICNDP